MLKLKRFKVIKENKIEKVHNYAHLNNKSAVEWLLQATMLMLY